MYVISFYVIPLNVISFSKFRHSGNLPNTKLLKVEAIKSESY